ncbi:glycosyltransferase family 4 protein [Kiritimatiella glycovorans]|uniref:Glycosyl transferase group 1 n=1 Tax=Kiritimatiella glycovorans TaxID=1307763 RepID=A0A0G3EMZ1_9BACT|nr:glycosyltransferase family 1 protein [Kiritimatiella glycovorans]AKJ65499.1 Glycosyl transferase group 1 [Kiritimatiella glycovorans]
MKGDNLRVAIDLAPMRPGKGGTGSGIWTYACELLQALDTLPDAGDMEILCLVRPEQRPLLPDPGRTDILEVPEFPPGILPRLDWVHRRLPRICRNERIDVLHKLATEVPWRSPAAGVTTVHDFFYRFLFREMPPPLTHLRERLNRAYFDLMERRCFATGARIITVSEAVAEEARTLFPKAADRIRTVPHGAPAPDPLPRPREGAPFTFICVAKFMPYKGQDKVLRAFEHLHQSITGPDKPRLLFRGFENDRDYYDQLRRRIESSRAREDIEILGYQADAGIREIYAESDAALLFSACEGFGLPVLEAQSLGLPMICSGLPVLREVGGAAAVYVDHNDPAVAAAEMERLMTDPAHYRRIRETGLENVKRFSWAQAAERTRAIYRQAAAS